MELKLHFYLIRLVFCVKRVLRAKGAPECWTLAHKDPSELHCPTHFFLPLEIIPHFLCPPETKAALCIFSWPHRDSFIAAERCSTSLQRAQDPGSHRRNALGIKVPRINWTRHVTQTPLLSSQGALWAAQRTTSFKRVHVREPVLLQDCVFLETRSHDCIPDRQRRN